MASCVRFCTQIRKDLVAATYAFVPSFLKIVCWEATANACIERRVKVSVKAPRREKK